MGVGVDLGQGNWVEVVSRVEMKWKIGEFEVFGRFQGKKKVNGKSEGM